MSADDGAGSGAEGVPGDAGAGDARSDAELIALLRGRGADRDSTAAFATLYARHQLAARVLARQLARSPADADDLVAGAFTRMLEVLRAGRGPTEAFRAYLLTSVRHLAYDRSRAERRVDLTDDLTDVQGVDPDRTIVPFTDPALAGLERTMAARAFATLPERWQAVLWHLEVEGDTPADIAPLFGLSANAVSALGYRAREGLRQAYLQEHLDSGSGRWDRRHRETGEKLGAYTRGGLARREAERVEAHLAECSECRALADELRDVNAGMLRAVVAPLVLGAGVLGYLASRGSTGPLAFPASTGELAVAGGGALGLLGALTGITGAVRPVPPVRVRTAGVIGLAGAVGLAAVVLGDALEPAPPVAARPAPVIVPPGVVPPGVPEVLPPGVVVPDVPEALPPGVAVPVPDASPGSGAPGGGAGPTPGTERGPARAPSPEAVLAIPGLTGDGGDGGGGDGGGDADRPTAPDRASRSARAAAAEAHATAAARRDTTRATVDGRRAEHPAPAARTTAARARPADLDCLVTARLPVLGGTGVICRTGTATREASLHSAR